MTPARDRLLLGGAALLAWALLWAGDFSVAMPGFCAGGDGAPTPAKLLAGLDAMLRTTSIGHLLSGWALMFVAMMAPLVRRPVAMVRARGRSVTLFLAGYAALWLPALGLLMIASLLLRLALAGAPEVGAVVAGGAVLLWQLSPWRGHCLAACRRPPCAGDFRAGAAQAIGCIGACAAAMLLPPLFGAAHLAVMALIALALWIERELDWLAHAPRRAEAPSPRLG